MGFLDYPGHEWRDTECAGTTYSAGDEKSGLIYIRKTPDKPKAPKVVWAPKKLPEMTIRTTKRQIRDHLELAIMELNDIGAKWAKAQNTINTLKKKVAK